MSEETWILIVPVASLTIGLVAYFFQRKPPRGVDSSSARDRSEHRVLDVPALVTLHAPEMSYGGGEGSSVKTGSADCTPDGDCSSD